jgi:ribose 5-phosphate isomerase B
MKLTIGSDHRGHALKKYLIESLPEVDWFDVGTDSESRVDYPEFAHKVCSEVISGSTDDRGILICGSGIGMSIAANRFPGIYAALCWDKDIAQVARMHDLANVLVLPADFISYEDSLSIVEHWLKTDFLGGRYQSRLDMIDAG